MSYLLRSQVANENREGTKVSSFMSKKTCFRSGWRIRRGHRMEFALVKIRAPFYFQYLLEVFQSKQKANRLSESEQQKPSLERNINESNKSLQKWLRQRLLSTWNICRISNLNRIEIPTVGYRRLSSFTTKTHIKTFKESGNWSPIFTQISRYIFTNFAAKRWSLIGYFKTLPFTQIVS